MMPHVADHLGSRGAFAAQSCQLLVGMLSQGGLCWEWPARSHATLPAEGACLSLRVSQDGSTQLAAQTKRLALWDLTHLSQRGGCTAPVGREESRNQSSQ